MKEEFAAGKSLIAGGIWGTAIVQRGHDLVGETCNELAAVYHVCNSLSSDTSNVERSLGKLSKQLEVHSGPAFEDTMAGLALIANAPMDDESWARKPAASAEFGDRCKAGKFKFIRRSGLEQLKTIQRKNFNA